MPAPPSDSALPFADEGQFEESPELFVQVTEVAKPSRWREGKGIGTGAEKYGVNRAWPSTTISSTYASSRLRFPERLLFGWLENELGEHEVGQNRRRGRNRPRVGGRWKSKRRKIV
jgi:hypothetical protein